MRETASRSSNGAEAKDKTIPAESLFALSRYFCCSAAKTANNIVENDEFLRERNISAFPDVLLLRNR